MNSQFSTKLAGNLYWSLVTVLTLMNSTIIFFGFHEHHDGLMLSTIRVAKESFLSGGDYPFNQYGSFWIAPYLAISFITPDSLLLASMRLVTFLMYFLTGVYTYKIAAQIFNTRVAKISILLFILAHPIGLEPIPWPSSVSMFLTVFLTWLMISHASRANRNHAPYYLAAAGVVCVMNILTRVQIGFLSTVVIIFYLAMTNWRSIIFFLYGSIGFSIFYFAILFQLGWLSDSLRDEFLFGWVVAISSQTDRTLPKTSLVFLVIALLFIFTLRLIQNRVRTLRFLIVFSAWVTLITLIVAKILLVDFSTLVGKIWVAVLIFACLLGGLKFLTAFQRGNYQECLLVGLGLAAASQIYPLFDIMHAWWGLTPILIILANQLDLAITRHNLLWNLTPAVVLASFALIATHALGTLAPSSEVDQKDLRLIRLDPASAKSYNELSEFFAEHIPDGSSVLNLCEDGRIFFRPNYVQSESRYFIYWSVMEKIEGMRNSLLISKPDYVVRCSDSKSPKVDSIIKKFTSAPYLFQGEFKAGERTVTVYEAPTAK